MAQHHLSIAKAAFAASLLRPDVTKITRDDVVQFHKDIEACLTRCTSENIEICKNWLLQNVMPSSQRSTAFGKYVISISKYVQQDNSKSTVSPNARTITAGRKSLHLLYLLNDVLHHWKHHTSHSQAGSDPGRTWDVFVEDLYGQAVTQRRPRILARLHDLVSIWQDEEHFQPSTLRSLERIVAGTNAVSDEGEAKTAAAAKSVEDLPFRMPATHGDPTLPYYDLPAANFMPHIMPNACTPMQPDRIKALRFGSGPAEQSLVSAVKGFLKDVEALENTYTYFDEQSIAIDMDELGQLSYLDEDGERKSDTYYGWSRSFCESMKSRLGVESSDTKHARKNSASNSSMTSPRKRRRYSESPSGGSSYSRSPSRSRERRPRRSLSPLRKSGSHIQQEERIGGSTAPVLVLSQAEAPSLPGTRSSVSHIPTPPPAFMPHAGLPPVFVPPFAPNGFPIPPPRPPNWLGPWPPPPPPPFPAPINQYGFQPPGAGGLNFPGYGRGN